MSRIRYTALLSVITILFTISAATCFAQVQDETPHWYKGNTHMHTFWSDGNQFPEMAVDWYRQHGYNFLAISDHNVLSEGEQWIPISTIEKLVKNKVENISGADVIKLCNDRFGENWVQTRQSQPNAEGNTELEVRLRTLEEIRPMFEKPGEFLMIQAEEITDKFENKPIHSNALNLQNVIPKQGGDSVRDVMRLQVQAVQSQEQQVGRPMLVNLNHPNYRWAISAEDLASVTEEEFFEVYNGSGGCNPMGDDFHPSVERIWDIANTIRIGGMKTPPLYGIASDDTHQYYSNVGSSPGKGWLMVRANKLDTDSLITAMQQGDYYISSGVTLRDIQYDPKARTIRIEIEPQLGESYTTVFYGTRVGYDSASTEPIDADGKPMDSTRIYSDTVGEKLSTQTGTVVTYQLTGDELYVRATISSDHATDNPSYDNQVKQAWTQPVGWNCHIDPANASRLCDPMQ